MDTYFTLFSQWSWTNTDELQKKVTLKMARKKVIKDPQEEIDAACKLLCDEAANHMKVRNYTKALNVYQKVNKLQIGRTGTVKLFPSNKLQTRFECRYRLILASEIQFFAPCSINLMQLTSHFLRFPIFPIFWTTQYVHGQFLSIGLLKKLLLFQMSIMPSLFTWK